MSEKKFTIQAYKLWQLAKLYKVSTKTLTSWIERMPETIKTELSLYPNAKYFTPKQVEIIVQHIGEPGLE